MQLQVTNDPINCFPAAWRHCSVGGKCNGEIGAVLNISEATVKVHITHILEKLNVTGRTEAINVDVKRGLVRIDPAAVA